jgi:DMSO/TMAO reductase YedYZ molybdopterin-dependent catalytic subunit
VSLPEDQPGITPVGELFTYHIFGLPPEARAFLEDLDSYRLSVGGLVESPLELSLGELREGFDAVSGEMVLQCITRVHWGRVRFTGARLSDVLERAGVRAGAVKVALRGWDGFDSDLGIEEVRANPDSFLLAYAMNDQPLPLDHGFPVRMASDGKYGYKWPKWLREVEVVDYDHRGHYEGKRGWSDAGTRGLPVT